MRRRRSGPHASGPVCRGRGHLRNGVRSRHELPRHPHDRSIRCRGGVPASPERAVRYALPGGLLLACVASGLGCSAELMCATSPTLDDISLAVRAGSYQQITSVVVARGDRVLYEQYFDTLGAAALRNTRSATKTITGMLIGA